MAKKQEIRNLVIIFLMTVVVYGAAVSFFTSTVHINVDEELYLVLARSFHYNGKFEYENQIVNYNCVLYSMLISLAYFFYSPERILFIMRVIGVISMSSSVFPIYFLARDFLGDWKKATKISIFLMIMPYMFDSAYIMQEVLVYPLFLWTVYFLYCAYIKENKKYIFLLLGAVFSILSMFTKTYTFFVPLVINICAFIEIAKNKDRSILINTAIYDVICLTLFIGMYYMIYAINGFESGTNHYASQFSRLFPISSDTILWGVLGCVIYVSFFIVNIGILPAGLLLKQWSKTENRSWLLTFLIISVSSLIIETVFMIVLTEQGVGTLPCKFLFRYFQIFVPIIFIIFEKFRNDISFLKSLKVQIVMIASLCINVFYFVIMRGNTRQSIMDGHFFLFIENMTKYIVPYADIFVMLVFLVLVIRMCHKKESITKIVHVTIIGMVLFWVIEFVQLPYYTNVIADGKCIQSDSIQIAQYLNSGGYEEVYYVYTSLEDRNSYARNFYGYIIQPYHVISKEYMDETLETLGKNRKVVFLFPTDLMVENDKLEKVSLDTERLVLCIPSGTE